MGNNPPEFIKKLLMGGGVDWDHERQMIAYEGEHYVVIGTDFGGSGGIFVMPRHEYATRKPASIQFIAAEFLVDVYPGENCDDGFTTKILKFGNAAHEEMDNLRLDHVQFKAEEDFSKDPSIKKKFESQRNVPDASGKRRWQYPELGEGGMHFLDLDVGIPMLQAAVDSLSIGDDEEALDKKMKEAHRVAHLKRLKDGIDRFIRHGGEKTKVSKKVLREIAKLENPKPEEDDDDDDE